MTRRGNGLHSETAEYNPMSNLPDQQVIRGYHSRSSRSRHRKSCFDVVHLEIGTDLDPMLLLTFSVATNNQSTDGLPSKLLAASGEEGY